MSIWSDVGTIVSATVSGDITFQTVQAYRSNAAWLVFAPLTVIGGLLVYYMYRFVPILDRHLERSIVVYSYILIAGIIFVGVIQRFVPYYDWYPWWLDWLQGQPPWSTTIPPLLFMIMAWFGCSFNVRLRTHLSFSEFRTKMGASGQMACLLLDSALWMGFCIMVVTTTARVTVNSYDNFQIVGGTDNVMVWWFVITVPIAFTLMAGRVLENLFEDIGKYRRGEPLIEQAVIGGDV